MKTLYVVLLVLLVSSIPPPNTDSIMPPPEFRLAFLEDNLRETVVHQTWHPPQYNRFIQRSIILMMMEMMDLRETIRRREL